MLLGPLGPLKHNPLPGLKEALRKLIKDELSALVSIYTSIEGTYAEASYKKKYNELLSKEAMDARASALTTAAKEVVEAAEAKSGETGQRSVCVVRSDIAVSPVFTSKGKIVVGIDLQVDSFAEGRLVRSNKEFFSGYRSYFFYKREVAPSDEGDFSKSETDTLKSTVGPLSGTLSIESRTSAYPSAEITQVYTQRSTQNSGQNLADRTRI